MKQKLYILYSFSKCWIIIWVASLFSGAIIAQDLKDVVTGNDSALWYQIQPGVLFNTSNVLSTSSVSTVSGEVLERTGVSNITKTLNGRLAGLIVGQTSDEPGNSKANLMIHGLGSYQSAGMTLFVDGYETIWEYAQYLSPAEIKSISILKDAAALAPLGLKGANGAIWIVTKRGNIGPPRIQLNAQTGFQSPVVPILKPLRSFDYASLYNEAYFNDNGREWNTADQPYTNNQLQSYQSGTGTDVDWYSETLKKNAPYTNVDLSIRGGSDTARYFILLGYNRPGGIYNVDNDDTHANTRLSSYNIRANADFKLFSIFEAKMDVGSRIDEITNPNNGGTYAYWNNLAKYPSNIYPVKNEDGTWTGTPIYPDNPVATLTERGYSSIHNRYLQANFLLKEKLDMVLKGLYISQSVSFSLATSGTYAKTRDYARYIDGVQTLPNENTPYVIWDDNGTEQVTWKTYTANIGYDKQLRSGKLTAMMDYRIYSYNTDDEHYPNTGFKNLGGRVNYNIKNRYITEFGFAYSGSDNFREGNRWGFFPTVSAAWIISNENFLKGSKIIDFLKLRASAGVLGNDRGPRYPFVEYFDRYRGGINTGNGTPTWHNGQTNNLLANPDVFAEKSLKYNAGFEARLLKSLTLVFDVFLDKRSDILTVDYSKPAVLGADLAVNNIGEVTNRGVDLTVDFTRKLGKFEFSLGGMVGYNMNQIDYMGEVPPAESYMSYTGNPIGANSGLEAIGFYDITDFEADGNLISDIPLPTFGLVQPGDIRYADLNKDNRIDFNDMKVSKNTSYPRYNYAFTLDFNYAGFDFKCLFQGMAIREVNLLYQQSGEYNYNVVAFANNSNSPKMAKNRWAYYPDQNIDTRTSATYPRLSLQLNPNNYINSSFWYKNGNFMRLRHVELGYTIPNSVSRKLKMEHARLFINVINPLTLSKLLNDYGFDPEVMYGYPAMKSFNLGFSLIF